MKNRRRDRVILEKILAEADMAAHKYLALRMEDVYNTVKIDTPFLREAIMKITSADH